MVVMATYSGGLQGCQVTPQLALKKRGRGGELNLLFGSNLHTHGQTKEF